MLVNSFNEVQLKQVRELASLRSFQYRYCRIENFDLFNWRILKFNKAKFSMHKYWHSKIRILGNSNNLEENSFSSAKGGLEHK